MLVLRSILFNIVMWVSIFIYSPLSLLSYPFPPRLRYPFIMQWARFNIWALRHICRLDYYVEGRENLPSKPAVILSKHQSAWETLSYQVILPPFVWVLKRELMWIPVFGWSLALLRAIAVQRASGRRAVDQVVKQGSERLQSGLCVLVFPEGTRMPPRTRGKYKIGGPLLASATGYPVIPIAHNAGSYWPRRGFVKYPGVIRMVIGPAIETEGRTPAEIRRQAESWIESTMKELEAETAVPEFAPQAD